VESKALHCVDAPRHSHGLAVQHLPRYHVGYRAALIALGVVLASEALARGLLFGSTVPV
jgi:hypothetical protein